jgi:hypothetical protein
MEIVKEAAGQHIAHAAKIGIAGVVSILAAKLLKLPQGYWQRSAHSWSWDPMWGRRL